MNAITQTRASAVSGHALSAHELGVELLRGIQLNRANAMALTRLQFALKSGDRQQAMEAMDRLHALDAEIERLAERLPLPDNDDGEWQAVTRHLGDQKLAIAFEKLALASAISGPGMVSEPAALVLTESLPPLPQPANEPAPPLAEWPALPQVEPAEWRPINHNRLLHVLVFGIAAALVLLAAALVLATI